jgi:hypothetical protein
MKKIETVHCIDDAVIIKVDGAHAATIMIDSIEVSGRKINPRSYVYVRHISGMYNVVVASFEFQKSLALATHWTKFMLSVMEPHELIKRMHGVSPMTLAAEYGFQH